MLPAGPIESSSVPNSHQSLLIDHSAYDSYALEVRTGGKTPFYSGDRRGHGRKAALFEPTGIGKTWLGCALAQKACRDGFTVLHKRTTELLRELAVAQVR